MNTNIQVECKLSNKIEWIDSYRGFGILLVVLGHCLPPFNKFIYGFHMPLFFMLSGYLWHYESGFKYICRKYTQRYILPYFAYCFLNLFICCSIELIQYGDTPFTKYLIGIIYSIGNTEWMPNCSPLWFLTSLFMSLIIMYIIFSTSGWREIVLIVVCFSISVVMDYYDCFKLPWNIDAALMGVVFVFIGYKIRTKNYILVKSFDEKYYLFGPLLLCVGYILIHFNPIDKVSFATNQYGNPLLFLSGALSMCVGIMILFKNNKFISRIKFLKLFGKHTIFIMGFDYFIGTIANVLLNSIGYCNWWSMFICRVLILLISIICLEQLIKCKLYLKCLSFLGNKNTKY